LLTASQTASDPHAHEAVLVSETLRIAVTRFAGVDGFAALLRRALALAREDLPSLQEIEIGADGRMQGFESLDANTGTGARGREAAVALTAHLLGLLVTFVGEPLMLRLVREAWPDLSLDE